MIRSSFLPLTPPSLLMSSVPHWAARTWSVPNRACGPVMGIARPIGSAVPSARAGMLPANALAIADPSTVRRRMVYEFKVLTPRLPRFHRQALSSPAPLLFITPQSPWLVNRAERGTLPDCKKNQFAGHGCGNESGCANVKTAQACPAGLDDHGLERTISRRR